MNAFKKFKAYLTLRSAIQLAEEQYCKDMDRYYVVHDIRGKLIVMCRKDFKYLKRKHIISERARITDVIRECFYYTRHLTSEPIPDMIATRKRQEYFDYLVGLNILQKKQKAKERAARKEEKHQHKLEFGTKL